MPGGTTLLEGRVAVITGAGQGIGRGIARRMTREGARVVVAEHNAESGPAVVEELIALGGDAVFVPTDVTDEAQARGCVEAAVERFGRVDVLVNNAYTGTAGTRLRLEWKLADDMRHDFELNTVAALWTMQAAFPHMKAQGAGSIINICSLNGVNAHMYTAQYNASKEALRTLTRTAAVEWGPHNIRSNVICPGAATEASKRMEADNPEMFAKMVEANPMRRFGDPEEDIGGAAVLLASDLASYINGNTLMVGGGTHVNGVPWRMDLPETLEEMG
jgi:NAD(P)-dependent dehydrogenase (short-subunit alcohol dehydrogenase family)